MVTEVLVEIARAVAQFGAGILFHLLNHAGLIGCLVEQILKGNIDLPLF